MNPSDLPGVIIGGMREYDDGTFVDHETLQRITGGRPHQSKRGDEGTDRKPASVIGDVILYVGDVINVNGTRCRIVATTPDRALELRPID